MDESFLVYRKTCRSEEKECDIKADFMKKTVKEKEKEKRKKKGEKKGRRERKLIMIKKKKKGYERKTVKKKA